MGKGLAMVSKTDTTNEYKVNFSVDSHLIAVLGEQLITSEQVGILELVKNAYDAGANECKVLIEKVPGLEIQQILATDEEIKVLSGPVITIIDDGHGMNLETLEKGWLRAATTFKTNFKEKYIRERNHAIKLGRLETFEALQLELKKANKGRLPIGEKGIGRLATHRLGRYLWLRTKRSDDPKEWELRIDWDLFDYVGDKPKDLSDVPLILRHQEPTFEYGDKNQGTVIRCYGGRAGFSWTEKELISVGRAISGLKSPSNIVNDFNSEFVKVYNHKVSLESPVYRIPAQFNVKASINEYGVADINIYFTPTAHLSDLMAEAHWAIIEDLRDKGSEHWREAKSGNFREPSCGPFEMNFDIWYRDNKWLKEDKHEISEYLDLFGGVGLYRDGLAVMPAEKVAYSDSLALNVRARKKTSKISYYNMFGQIEISQVINPDVRDQSSREGQLNNQEFVDLMTLARAVVLIAEEYYIKKREELNSKILKPVPHRTVRNHSRMAANILNVLFERYEFRDDEYGISKTLQVDTAKAKELVGEVTQTLENVDQHLKLIEDQHKGLIEAAGYGLAIAIAIHELGKSLSNINTLLERTTKKGKQLLPSEMEILLEHSKAIESEFKRIAPLRVTRLERSRIFNIRKAIMAAISAVKTRADATGVRFVVLQDEEDFFDLKARYTACSQVIANLLDNSIYWLNIPSWKGKDKIIRISSNKHKRVLEIEDTGPGVHPVVIERLFQPFVTKKSDGQGLGLYICDFYLRQMKAKISYKPIPTSGARFVLDFSKVPEE